jgi:predicted outer membrane repeat protein
MLVADRPRYVRSNRSILRFELLENRDNPNAFVVNSLADLPDAIPGDGIADTKTARIITTTLRAAVDESNALGGTHTISFDPALFAGGPGVITLSKMLKELPFAANITVTGPGSGTLSITRETDETVPFELIKVAVQSTSSITDLSLQGGQNLTESGGAINNMGGLTIENCSITNCSAQVGGAIANSKQLTIRNSNIQGNTATTDGGGIYCAANANCVTDIWSVTIKENTANKG